MGYDELRDRIAALDLEIDSATATLESLFRGMTLKAASLFMIDLSSDSAIGTDALRTIWLAFIGVFESEEKEASKIIIDHCASFSREKKDYVLGRLEAIHPMRDPAPSFPSEDFLISAQSAQAAVTTSDHLRQIARMGQQIVARIGKTVPALVPALVDFNAFHSFVETYMPFRDSMEPTTNRECLHMLHRAATWAKEGFNVFNLTHGLAAGLVLTDPPEYVPGEAFEAPFRTFAVTIPPGIIPVFIHGQQHWAELIWCYAFRSLHKSSPGKGSQDFLRWIAYWRGIDVYQDRIATDLLFETDQITFNLPGDPPVQGEDKITTSATLRLLRNLVLWLDSTGGIAGHDQDKVPRQPRKKQDRDKDKSWPTTWVLGREVKLQPELRRMAAEVALGHNTKHAASGWKVRQKFIVRGHWKQQFYGPGRGLRKRIHVAAYWKGPEGEAAWSHLYTDAKEPS